GAWRCIRGRPGSTKRRLAPAESVAGRPRGTRQSPCPPPPRYPVERQRGAPAGHGGGRRPPLGRRPVGRVGAAVQARRGGLPHGRVAGSTSPAREPAGGGAQEWS